MVVGTIRSWRRVVSFRIEYFRMLLIVARYLDLWAVDGIRLLFYYKKSKKKELNKKKIYRTNFEMILSMALFDLINTSRDILYVRV